MILWRQNINQLLVATDPHDAVWYHWKSYYMVSKQENQREMRGNVFGFTNLWSEYWPCFMVHTDLSSDARSVNIEYTDEAIGNFHNHKLPLGSVPNHYLPMADQRPLAHGHIEWESFSRAIRRQIYILPPLGAYENKPRHVIFINKHPEEALKVATTYSYM